MSPVDEDREPDGLGPPQLGQGIQRRAHRATGEENVVHEHNRLVVDPRRRDVRVFDRPDRVLAKVVAVHRDVKGAAWHLATFDLGHHPHKSTGERDPTGRDTQDDKVLGAPVAFKDLVGDASQGPGDVTRAHHDPRGPGWWIPQGTIGRWSSVWTRHGAEPPSPPHRTGR